ncbi:ATP-binding cassette domain-containing protein [Streptomyces sp. NPDC057445]|uniref:ATP-binding cassette domain-containing protein n=1 Tax=Streptomyces sp. NPDC057445 TaxID=3346136 RepID=UPI0036A657AE
MIRFENVSVTYADSEAPTVRGVDLTVPEGELVLLVGPSGAGKSTLLGAVSGLVPHFTGGTLRGRVTVCGRDTRTHKPRELADVVGTVGQDPLAHFVTDTVEDELAYGMESLGLAPDVMRRRVEETLDLLGLADLRDRPIATLSGGQQQRVAIGSVLTPHPRVLVLDEPTSALDPAAAEEVLAVLQRLVHDLGTTVLMAEHRLERVVQYADQVILLPSPGAEPVMGPPAEIMAASPVHPPVVALGRYAGWTPLPLTVRDARRRAVGLRDRLSGKTPPPPAAAEGRLTGPGLTTGPRPLVGAPRPAAAVEAPDVPGAGSGAAGPQAPARAVPAARSAEARSCATAEEATAPTGPGAGAAAAAAWPRAAGVPDVSAVRHGAPGTGAVAEGRPAGAGPGAPAGAPRPAAPGEQARAVGAARSGDTAAQSAAPTPTRPGTDTPPASAGGRPTAAPGISATPAEAPDDSAVGRVTAATDLTPGPGAQAPQARGPRAAFARLWRRPAGPVAPTTRGSASAPGTLVAVDRLSVRRGRTEALRAVRLEVRAGEAVALMGRNGAGKSTLLSTLVGMIEPTSGGLTVGGRVPHRTSARELIREVGLVPQEPRDLLYADTVAAECAAADADAGAAPGTCRALVSALLPGVPDPTHPRDLSEGQRLALALALVLTARPPVLLLDEPTRGLDYAAKARLVAVLRDLAAEGHAIVLATHDVELAAELAHRVVILAGGEVVADGPTADVVVSSPAFAPQVAKVLAPGPWLTVAQVEAAL